MAPAPIASIPVSFAQVTVATPRGARIPPAAQGTGLIVVLNFQEETFGDSNFKEINKHLVYPCVSEKSCEIVLNLCTICIYKYILNIFEDDFQAALLIFLSKIFQNISNIITL